MTPPAISTSIAQLERELGVQLFTRHANRLQLNKQGEIFLGYVEAILKSINRARTEIQESIKSGPQHISVAVTSSNLWIDLTAAFSKEKRRQKKYSEEYIFNYHFTNISFLF